MVKSPMKVLLIPQAIEALFAQYVSNIAKLHQTTYNEINHENLKKITESFDIKKLLETNLETKEANMKVLETTLKEIEKLEAFSQLKEVEIEEEELAKLFPTIDNYISILNTINNGKNK